MKFSGVAHKYGDNINTDVIIPGRYCNTIDYNKLAAHCLEDLDKEFVYKVKPGDILVAGFNFGCGSSREVAPIAIKYAGIACVIAKSFARIFYRNSINMGLYLIESPLLVEDIRDGEKLELSITQTTIFNKTTGYKYDVPADDSIIQEIIKAGGLVNYVKEKFGN